MEHSVEILTLPFVTVLLLDNENVGWFGPLWDWVGSYDSGKEMDVNLIHIYKMTFLKCTSQSVPSFFVCITLLDYRR